MQKIHFKNTIFLILLISLTSCSTINENVYYANKSAFNYSANLFLSNYEEILESYKCQRNLNSDAISIERSCDCCSDYFNLVDSTIIDEIFQIEEITSITLSPEEVFYHFKYYKFLFTTTSYSLLYTKETTKLNRYYEDKDFSVSNIDSNWYFITLKYDNE